MSGLVFVALTGLVWRWSRSIRSEFAPQDDVVELVERVPSPDPVTEAAAYQRHLVGLVGDDDPADAQATAADAWRELIREAGARVAERPEPDEWSVLECLGTPPTRSSSPRAGTAGSSRTTSRR